MLNGQQNYKQGEIFFNSKPIKNGDTHYYDPHYKRLVGYNEKVGFIEILSYPLFWCFNFVSTFWVLSYLITFGVVKGLIRNIYLIATGGL